MTRTSLCALVAALLGATSLCGQTTSPEPLPATSPDPIIIHRRVVINEPVADLGARLYDKVEYELHLRQLDADIRLTRARIQAFQDRDRFYDRNFSRTPALLLTRQNTKLDLLEAQEKLKQLRQEKVLLLRHRAERVEYRKLLIKEGDVELEL